MLGHRELTPSDYSDILRRRRWAIILPAVLGPVIAYGISVELPSRYISQTLILIEQQRVPDNFVKPVITEDLNARIGTMQEQILSRSRLQPIIERFGLFKKDIGREPMEELVSRMRKAITLVPVQSVVSNRDRDLPGFYVTYTSDSPQVAQQVCAEITSMFIEENFRQRQQSAQGTTNFLQGQLEDAKRKMDDEDAKLAKFKTKYLGVLPDETQTNLNLLNVLNTQLEAGTQGLNRAQQDKAYTQSLLAQQLAAWDAMREGNPPHPETVQQQLATLESQLFALQARYTSDHPDVIKLKSAIEQFKKNSSAAASASNEKPADMVEPLVLTEPPQIQQLRSQLHSYEEAIRSHTRDQERLRDQIKIYQSRVQLSPVVEREYKELTRDYQSALNFYNELLAKRNQSEMATDLERRQQGEQFRVMDPANLPEEPSFPNRPLIAASGFGGGLALGLVLALVLEFRDKSIRTEHDVEFFLNLPALCSVPSIDYSKRKVWEASARKRNTKANRPARPGGLNYV